MKSCSYALAVLFLSTLLLLSTGSQARSAEGKVSALMYSDIYWLASHPDSEIEGSNGFWFRRIYLTYDGVINEEFSARFRIEMNSPGDFTSKSKLEPFVKDAYLAWKKSGHQVLLGISSSPTWGVVEKHWGYRSVEKTPLDLQKFGSSRDWGVAAKGPLDGEGLVKYHVMVGNGNSTSSETDEGKKIMGAISARPSENLVLEAYGDFNDMPDLGNRSKDIFTVQGFAGYKGKAFRAGAQFAHQVRKNHGYSEGMEEDEDLELSVASVFGVAKVSENVNLIGRFDKMLDPNPDAGGISYIPFDPAAESNFVLLGVDYGVAKDIRIIPNIELVFYDTPDEGEAPDATVMPRLTIFAKF